MKQLPDPQYRVPQWALTAAIEGLKELALRLEIDASGLARMGTHDSALLADELLDQRELYLRAHEFYLNL